MEEVKGDESLEKVFLELEEGEMQNEKINIFIKGNYVRRYEFI